MAIHTQHSDRKLRMDVALRPAELAIVRRIARSQLHGWGLAAEVDDVLTVVNELLTNVVDHVPGAHCTLTLERKAHLLHVRVSDNCRSMPVKQQPEATRTTGRGLALVDALTHGRWKVVLPPNGEGKEIHCLFDISQAVPPTEPVKEADIVREIFRYGLARPDQLADVIHHSCSACDHFATGESCTHHCLAVTVGSVVRSGRLVRLSEGRLTPQDDSPAAAARRIAAKGTGLRPEPVPTAPPLWIEQRGPDVHDNRRQRGRLHYWYLFEAPHESPEPQQDPSSWTPIADLPPTPLRDLIATSAPRRH
ncbi:ATP-binding protein [Streptomyces netropsis]|uniref:ATP-binding protein n=1 Tax=Streptomyces netropsis TaxID=55404 RepID=UPI0030D212EF